MKKNTYVKRKTVYGTNIYKGISENLCNKVNSALGKILFTTKKK